MKNEKDNLFGPIPVDIAPSSEPPQQFNDSIDIRSLAMTLWRGKWIVAICLLISYVIAYLSVSQIVPTYRANTTVMFDIQQSNIVDLQEVIADQGFDRGRLEDQMLVLSSTKLIERVIEAQRLHRDPEFNPSLRIPKPTLSDRIGQIISLPPEITDLLQDFGLVRPDAPQTENPQVIAEERDAKLQATIVRNVTAGLELSPVGNSRVLDIAFVADDPQTAAAVANQIANEYIVDQLEAKLEATRAATAWLSVRVEELRVRLQAAENAVQSARAEFTEERGQGLDVTRQQLGALNNALASARGETTRALTKFERLKAALDDPASISNVSEFRNAPVIVELRNRETKLQSEITKLQASVSRVNPSLELAQRELEGLRQEISTRAMSEARQIVAAAENDLKSARQQEAALLGQVRELEQKSLLQAEDELRLRQLEREAQASRVLYENFLGRLQETNAQEDLQAADARVLSPAEVPARAQSQQRQRTMTLTMFLGGAIGVAIVYLLNYLNNTFRSPQQLEEMTGETVLGTIPSLGSRIKRSAVLEDLRNKPGSSMAESIRNLRTSILMSNIDKPPKVVMFTSSVPREGKTTTAMMMAMTSRQMGKSAILVDCDLRLPALARMIPDDGDRPGLMSVLAGTCNIADAIHQDKESGLHVLLTKSSERQGAINAADTLSSHRFQQLIKMLCENYELVILDTPPALIVTDARILARLADAVIYAVRWDKTPRGAVLEGLKELRSVNAPIAGVAMTFINEARATRYSYDGYSYYKGRYKDYYMN